LRQAFDLFPIFFPIALERLRSEFKSSSINGSVIFEDVFFGSSASRSFPMAKAERSGESGETDRFRKTAEELPMSVSICSNLFLTAKPND